MGAEDSTTARARRKQQRSTRSARQHLPPPSCAHEGGPPRGRSHTGQSRPPAAGSAPRSSGPAALLGRGRIFSGRSDAPGVKGGIETTLKKEVLHYDYSSSYFDIFFTTAVTSAFLLAKVIISQLFSQGAFGYVLPIISFILAWIETWFLDFKVLPQEAEEENRFLIAQGASERAALLHPGVLSDGQFYSPPESVAGSDEDSEEKQDSEKPVV
ncbi:STARD3 N-terminal-like protein isoform X3 [Gallus gallus]|uniref:STARD3 N-terminal-like protein isoform X3 n=1 Tax=Gallus gallus TaxID=9031 RepID=UPI001F005E99|nr:STARD3 N-terminal-like protein isoform X3 [Gallus gallus]